MLEKASVQENKVRHQRNAVDEDLLIRQWPRLYIDFEILYKQVQI